MSLGGWVGGWSDTDNKASLSPASLRYATNGALAELGKNPYYLLMKLLVLALLLMVKFRNIVN